MDTGGEEIKVNSNIYVYSNVITLSENIHALIYLLDVRFEKVNAYII